MSHRMKKLGARLARRRRKWPSRAARGLPPAMCARDIGEFLAEAIIGTFGEKAVPPMLRHANPVGPGVAWMRDMEPRTDGRHLPHISFDELTDWEGFESWSVRVPLCGEQTVCHGCGQVIGAGVHVCPTK